MGADGRLWRGQSPALSPVVNDFTEAGTIALEADGEAFDRDLGQPVAVAPGNPSVTQLHCPSRSTAAASTPAPWAASTSTPPAT